ncbi:MAG: A/G-specific adenine glycosylase, partial [Helicobacter sp.]|nr:A/G-specific adenine glycosylase [Helicobacter sp.]
MQLSHTQNRRAFHAALLEWYAQNGRLELPWRNLHDDAQRAYKVYVSEIMLQQTQVQVVVPYFARFVARFESLRALANAQQEEVLQQWQGLGYYTRARNMHKAAQLCGASLPQSLDALLRLPGIGRYTAGAILCFGFAQPVCFVDANIGRVLSRLFALPSPKQSELLEKAQMLLNANDSFAHNQALLDIGAAVCLPKNPACSACPLLRFCKGTLAWERYGAPKPKTTESKALALAFVRRGDCIALVQSRERLYYGLY